MTAQQDTSPRSKDAARPAESSYQFTGHQYRCMIETGVLGPEDKVELIQGEIRYMPPMSSEHSASIEQLDEWFQDHRRNDYRVRCQLTLHLGPDFSPDPDLAIVRRREQSVGGIDPQPADVLLIIEISKTSLQRDLGQKALGYARAQVPEVWVIDTAQRELHRLTHPSEQGYLNREVFHSNDTLTPQLLPQLAMPLSQGMPEKP